MFKNFFSQGKRAEQIDRFQYERLEPESIRLLKRLPRDGGADGSKYELSHFQLRDEPTYTTLSYVWGSQRQTAEINVNGRSLPIGKNLNAFLQQAARSDDDPDRLYWIDQICINQQDTAERSQQVALMGQIFSEAADMIVWLGDAAKHSDLAMEVLKSRDHPVLIMGGPDVEEHTRFYLTFEEAQAVYNLLARPYFSRLWIVQEMNLAKAVDVWCGSKRVDAAAVTALLKAQPVFPPSRRKPEEVTAFRNEIDEATRALFYAREGEDGHLRLSQYSLVSALGMYSNNQCFNARDKIYGLMGIIYGGPKITADYTKSRLEVFVDVLNWYLYDREEADEEVDNEGPDLEHLDVILRFGYRMGVIRVSVIQRNQERGPISQWVQEHPGQRMTSHDMSALL